MTRQEIFDAINSERNYQDSKWGTNFDDKNSINDWGTYINIYLAKATNMGETAEVQEENLLKVASLAVAALETFYRNNGFAPRHYDPIKV
jgi:hypothetical protein